MGVTGFFALVENDSNLRHREVDVAKEARRAVEERGRNPVLVVDLCNTVRQVWADLDWFCGGQHRLFRKNIDTFIRRFKQQVRWDWAECLPNRLKSCLWGDNYQ